jgi:hypothetical protein
MSERTETRQTRARIMIQVGAGAFTLVAAVLFMVFMPGPRTTADDSVAMGTGWFFLGICVTMPLVHILRPQDAPQRLRPVSQVIAYLTSGLALLIPMIAPGKLAPGTLFAMFLVVVAVSLVAGWRVWRAADELMRTMMKDSSALAFAVTGGALCVYAAGERLGVLSGITFWGYFVFCSFVNVASSFYTIWRHGQHKFPPEE